MASRRDILQAEARAAARIPAARGARIDTLMEAAARRVATMTEAEAMRVGRVIRTSANSLKRSLAKTPDRTFTATQLRAQLLQVQRMREALAERLGPALSDGVTRAQAMAVAEMRDEVAQLSRRYGAPRQLDIDTALTVGDTSKLLVQRLQSATAKRSAEATADVADALAEATLRGMTFRQAGQLVSERVGVQAHWGERLARTELIHGMNAQRHDVAVAEGMQLEWSAALERACEICGAMDGQRITPGAGQFTALGVSVAHPPAHPNCFPVGTVVRGAFVAGLQARYAGEMVEVRTASGKRLALTANHPVLTSGGMVAANRLRQGMQAFSDALGTGDPSPLGRVNEHHGPAGIDEVLRALRREGATGSLAPSAGDLHGDGAGVHDNIDVVWSDGVLPIDAVPHASQGRTDLVFEVAAIQEPIVPGLRPGDLGFQGVNSTASGGVRRCNLPHSGGAVHDGPLQPLRVGSPPQFNATFAERSGERGSADAGDVADALERCAGRIVQDEIVEVRDYHFDGHVFDLQSTSGLMVAGGIVTSNCRCVATLYDPAWGES